MPPKLGSNARTEVRGNTEMFATFCWRAKAILAEGRKPTCFKTGQKWAGKTRFHGRKWQRVTDQPSQQGCLNSTFAWCQSHGRGMVQITRLLAGPSRVQRCQGRKFRRRCQHVRGQLAPVPPLSQRKAFWQGWWLQETTNEERHTYDEEGKGEGVTGRDHPQQACGLPLRSRTGADAVSMCISPSPPAPPPPPPPRLEEGLETFQERQRLMGKTD